MLPVIEYLTLRLWVRNSVHLRFGWDALTDYDLMLPAVLAFLLYIALLDGAAAPRLKLQ